MSAVSRRVAAGHYLAHLMMPIVSTDFVHEYRSGDSDKVTLLLLHGTGGDEHDLLPLGARVLPGATLLSPRGQVDEHGHARFFRRLAEGVFDVPDLQARADALAVWTRAQLVARGAPTRLVAIGFSNGANIASALLLQHPGLLVGAALIRAMLPYTPAETPSLTGTRVLISAGRVDPIVPHAQVEGLDSMLRAAGADVTLAWQPSGHGLTAADLTAVSTWLAAF